MNELKVPDRLLSREEMAYFLNVDTDTLHKYEKDGIVKRVPGLPSPKFSPKIVAMLAEIDMEAFNPLLLKRLEKRNKELEQENAMLRAKLDQIYQLTSFTREQKAY